MAKFVPILGPLRGKIGASVFSHNKGGDYVRRLGTPTNNNSVRQQVVRAILSGMSAGFNALDPIQKEQWKTWASENPRTDSIGNSYTMTGHQAYVSVNHGLEDAALTLLEEPPVGLITPELVRPTTTIDTVSSISVAFEGTCPTGGVLKAWMCAPQSGAGDPSHDQAYLIGYTAIDIVTPAVLTLPMGVGIGQIVNFWYTWMTAEGLVGTVEKDRVTRLV